MIRNIKISKYFFNESIGEVHNYKRDKKSGNYIVRTTVSPYFESSNNKRYIRKSTITQPVYEKKLKKYKINAKNRDLSFELPDSYAIQLFFSNCHYCGAEPGEKLSGIDRIDSNRGYSVDNTCSACKTCNFLKGILSVEDFLKKCSEIVTHRTLSERFKT